VTDREPKSPPTAEHTRLAEATGKAEDDLFSANPWYEWGPYLAERAWGSVREDYSADGDAWNSFTHDHARSRAYRWNEDGMAGISDIRHELCLALAVWNGVDPILKERMFGLTNPQGNHGEDAKEYWWYTEGLPSHALLGWRYHYPQAAYPYDDLVAVNGQRTRHDPEYELLDTGVFDEGTYWIIDVTYAKASSTEILASVTIENHGSDEATLDVLPTLWFRNTWRWTGSTDIPALASDDGAIVVERHARLKGYRLDAAPAPDGTSPVALFCDNETNEPKLFGGDAISSFPKDGINDHVVSGDATVNPAHTGTKAAWWYHLTVPGGSSAELRLRLHLPVEGALTAGDQWSGAAFDHVVSSRRSDADAFFAAITPDDSDDEEKAIVRQAIAGLVWSKQLYPYRVSRWLDGDPAEPPPPPGHATVRNTGWRNLDAFDVMAMPDPWEYPWFAAWDLAFHTIPWAHVDPAFAKYQLIVLLREWFLNPSGALPAYEWNFDDVNPPVHAFAALRVFAIDGGTDYDFLERVFQKLLLNFTWWLNRQDPDGNDLFGGGFLGLDNISPIDRSHLPEGMSLDQVDGTAWMALYTLSMLAMSVTLADRNPVYVDMVVKFAEQFVMIADRINESGIYDATDGFFYDRLTDASGGVTQIRVKTLEGAIPLLPAASVPLGMTEEAEALRKRFARALASETDAGMEFQPQVHRTPEGSTILVSVVDRDQLVKVLAQFFDEAAFLSPHGLRSLSKEYSTPYAVPGVPGATIDYEPAESTTAMFGGNSNWRGPVWFPINYLVIRALLWFDEFYGDDLTIEYPTGSGARLTLAEAAQDLADRLVSIWRRDEDGHRPVYGGVEMLNHDPAWRDHLLFFEYFDGDNGAGLGASHQTGWTALVAELILDRPASWSKKVLRGAAPTASG
jgi:hypothetical protein